MADVVTFAENIWELLTIYWRHCKEKNKLESEILWIALNCRQTSNIRRTESQNLSFSSRLAVVFAPGVMSRISM